MTLYVRRRDPRLKHGIAALAAQAPQNKTCRSPLLSYKGGKLLLHAGRDVVRITVDVHMLKPSGPPPIEMRIGPERRRPDLEDEHIAMRRAGERAAVNDVVVEDDHRTGRTDDGMALAAVPEPSRDA